MILQKLLLPKKDICSETQLYIGGEGLELKSNVIEMNLNSILTTETYFNSFSYNKWKKYTEVEKIKVLIDVEGCCKIYLCHVWIDEMNIIRRSGDNVIFFEKQKHKREKLCFDFPEHSKSTIAHVKIVTEKNKAKIYEIDYLTEEVVAREIKIAVGICTFQREEFINKNINKLKNDIIENEESILYKKLDLYVSDNGKTLPKDIVNNHIKIFPNLNLGGSGGFTRCLIEIKKNEIKNKYTHVILMDDDIVFDVDTLTRNYIFLSLLKKEYIDVVIGGAMLVLNEQYKQFENGASYVEGMLKFDNKNIDLRKLRSVVQNEREHYINYNAWCYCCMPLNKIQLNNLPMPFFIHMDDVEYGVRNKFKIITLNGICVWHPFFSNQRSVSIVYYDVRNKLITMSELGGVHIVNYALIYLEIFHRCIFNYDYQRTLIACKAIQDFCEGIDNFKEQDPLKLHKELGSYNKQWCDAEPNIEDSINNSFSNNNISRRALIINYLLPSKKKRIYCDCDISEIFPYRVKELVVYNRITGKQCTYRKSFLDLLKCKYQCYKTKRIINKKLIISNFEWKDRIKEIIDIKFWEKYLKIDGDEK